MSDQSLLYKVIENCSPDEALDARDPRYYDLASARMSARSPTQRLIQSITRVPQDRFETQLFSGHRGSGKTTELQKVRAELERQDFHVSFCGVSDLLDLSDVALPDLMLAIGKQLVDDMQVAGIKADLKKLDDIGGWFSQIEITQERATSIESAFSLEFLQSKLGNFTSTLKSFGQSKQTLRKVLNESPSILIEKMNALLACFTQDLHKQGKRGLVIIVDQLDRMHRKELASGTNAHSHLFIDCGPFLSGLKAHMIYTMPISLTLESESRRLQSEFKAGPLILPMVRVRTREGKRDEQGFRAFHELLQRRFDVAKAFDDQAIDLLIQMSGGHPRYLMQLIQTATEFVDQLPITYQAALMACRDRRNSELARLLSDAYLPELVRVHQEKSLEKSERSSVLLYYQYVLEYINGEPWYDVHPLIPSLRAFSKAWREAGHAEADDPLQSYQGDTDG